MKQIISGEKIISGIVTGIITGIIAGLAILVVTISLEQKASFSHIKGEINEADNFNLSVACEVKAIYSNTDQNLLLNYITQHYIENFDSLNEQPDSIKAAIVGNIVLMQVSNKMMDLLFEQPEKRTEFSPKLIGNAEKIIKNLNIYNEQIIEGGCAN